MVFLAVSHLAKSAQKGQEANENEGESFYLSEHKFTNGLGCTGKTNTKTQDKKWMRLGDKMINQQKVVFCLAEFSQVKRRAIKLPHGAICYVHFVRW